MGKRIADFLIKCKGKKPAGATAYIAGAATVPDLFGVFCPTKNYVSEVDIGTFANDAERLFVDCKRASDSIAKEVRVTFLKDGRVQMMAVEAPKAHKATDLPTVVDKKKLEVNLREMQAANAKLSNACTKKRINAALGKWGVILDG